MWEDRKRKFGFTILELVFVIAIIAIMVTLAIPAYRDLVEPASCAVAEANVRTVYTAAKVIEAQGLLTGNPIADAGLVEKLLNENGTEVTGKIKITENLSGNAIETVSWQGTVNRSDEYIATYNCSDNSYFSQRVKMKPKEKNKK
ncbi:MAG: prepilin-type N-terminal cleavage/methylation domain-containing protein [Oscillospiraceae bacterium]